MQRLCTKVYITCVKWEALKWKTNIMNKKSANKHLYEKRLFWGVCYRLLLMHGQLPVSGYVTTEKISSDKMPFNLPNLRGSGVHGALIVSYWSLQ